MAKVLLRRARCAFSLSRVLRSSRFSPQAAAAPAGLPPAKSLGTPAALTRAKGRPARRASMRASRTGTSAASATRGSAARRRRHGPRRDSGAHAISLRPTLALTVTPPVEMKGEGRRAATLRARPAMSASPRSKWVVLASDQGGGHLPAGHGDLGGVLLRAVVQLLRLPAAADGMRERPWLRLRELPLREHGLRRCRMRVCAWRPGELPLYHRLISLLDDRSAVVTDIRRPTSNPGSRAPGARCARPPRGCARTAP